MPLTFVLHVCVFFLGGVELCHSQRRTVVRHTQESVADMRRIFSEVMGEGDKAELDIDLSG